jgi:hypothetical protein
VLLPKAYGGPSGVKLIAHLCTVGTQAINLDKIESVLLIAVWEPFEAVRKPQILVKMPFGDRHIDAK